MMSCRHAVFACQLLRDDAHSFFDIYCCRFISRAYAAMLAAYALPRCRFAAVAYAIFHSHAAYDTLRYMPAPFFAYRFIRYAAADYACRDYAAFTRCRCARFRRYAYLRQAICHYFAITTYTLHVSKRMLFALITLMPRFCHALPISVRVCLLMLRKSVILRRRSPQPRYGCALCRLALPWRG